MSDIKPARRRQRILHHLADFNHLAKAIAQISRDILAERTDLEIELSRLPTPSVSATDHAIVRYLQRTKGINTEAIRREIETVCEPFVRDVGFEEAYPVEVDGIVYIVRKGKVLTVLSDDEEVMG